MTPSKEWVNNHWSASLAEVRVCFSDGIVQISASDPPTRLRLEFGSWKIESEFLIRSYAMHRPYQGHISWIPGSSSKAVKSFHLGVSKTSRLYSFSMTIATMFSMAKLKSGSIKIIRVGERNPYLSVGVAWQSEPQPLSTFPNLNDAQLTVFTEC